jgi:hypothetical protein
MFHEHVLDSCVQIFSEATGTDLSEYLFDITVSIEYVSQVIFLIACCRDRRFDLLIFEFTLMLIKAKHTFSSLLTVMISTREYLDRSTAFELLL